MSRRSLSHRLLLLTLGLAGPVTARLPAQVNPDLPPGHSSHGEVFDIGPRQQAVLLEGMGRVSFPITTKSPEAQAFFNQGVAQLHTFYYFEAERSFRQALYLDPDCAMAYWGMAMSNPNNLGRAQGFVERARRLLAGVTDRERRYLEALAALTEPGKSDADRRDGYLRGLEQVVLEFPDDLEAKAFLAWTIVSNGWAGTKISSHVATDRLIEDVLEKAPDHPGAHHYRIHLWDGRDATQALKSAAAYGSTAPGIAHAWHMPGHIYNGLSRWKDAVYQQTASACVDHEHMLRNAILPFEIHNYAHNQHYLIANQFHLGAAHAGLAFARNLVESPRDPEKGAVAQTLGRASIIRIAVRYGLWRVLLEDPHLARGEGIEDRGWAAYGRGFAHLGLGDLEAAREDLAALEAATAEAAKSPGRSADLLEVARKELRGRVLVRAGSLLEGFDLLHAAAQKQTESFLGDLAGYPRSVYESVGEAHLEAHDWGLAIASFEKVLEHRHGSFASLAGRIEALCAAGRREEAAQAHAEFHEAALHADPNLPCIRRVEALGLGGAAPSPASASSSGDDGSAWLLTPAPALRAEERALPPGPQLWAPTPAPDFSLADSAGAQHSISQWRGRYVVLVFHLGTGCTHCVEQLVHFGRELEGFTRRDGVVVGIGEDTPEALKAFLASPAGGGIQYPLLLDPGRQVAKAYRVHDTFEDLAIHGVVLLDRGGAIRWARVSANPFLDTRFLQEEIDRLEEVLPKGRTGKL